MYVISGCLMGHNCKYNGGNNRNEAVLAFAETRPHVIACPETEARLPVPREPAEWKDGRVIDRGGKDITEDFLRGSVISMNKVLKGAEARGEEIEGAILKANSPSCGSGVIYDGTFSGSLVPGDGCFTAMLKERGIRVISEKELEADPDIFCP